MSDKEYSFRYWVVNCLGCRNPIPLYAEPVDASEAPVSSAGDIGLREERPYFRVWCMECGREYPYLSKAMKWTHEPPLDKHNRQVEFTRLRQRVKVKDAHA
jgi:ribosomal protein S27E